MEAVITIAMKESAIPDCADSRKEKGETDLPQESASGSMVSGLPKTNHRLEHHNAVEHTGEGRIGCLRYGAGGR